MHGRTDELSLSSINSLPLELKQKLIQLAQKYESAEFLEKDPSKFMHRYTRLPEVETVSFIAANLAFGRREQILLHVEKILEAAGTSPSEWIFLKKYESFFPDNEKSFYRMYTNRDMRIFFNSLRLILEEAGTPGEFFRQKWNEALTQALNEEQKVYLHQVIASVFPKECKLLPHSETSAAKKLNMLLRWLVRDNSPVDLGIWSWYDKKSLLMPLDTHVMQQANELKLISSKSANLNTAFELTKKAAEVFPGDPVKLDFALFGLGVNS
ncbi:TIGR02757 family protein [Treponema sp.]|uniref:TIGR02757 family protein n=1 Tax=Treponema sp. TaxID=166 RepID=UPI00388EEC0B